MEYLVMNRTDGITASHETYPTREAAEQFIKKFRERFKTQGYYLDHRRNRISPEDVILDIIEFDETLVDED